MARTPSSLEDRGAIVSKVKQGFAVLRKRVQRHDGKQRHSALSCAHADGASPVLEEDQLFCIEDDEDDPSVDPSRLNMSADAPAGNLAAWDAYNCPVTGLLLAGPEGMDNAPRVRSKPIVLTLLAKLCNSKCVDVQ